jgi:hypothetical protein
MEQLEDYMLIFLTKVYSGKDVCGGASLSIVLRRQEQPDCQNVFHRV